MPLVKRRFEEPVTFVKDVAGAQELLSLAHQLPIAWVSIDFEFRYSRPGIFIKKFAGKEMCWYDPKACAPLLLAVVLVERNPDGSLRLYRFVIDCRIPAVVAATENLFRMPVTFVGHSLRAELICMWQLGLPIPGMLWDTWVAEKALLLGLSHANYKGERPVNDMEEADRKDEAEEEGDLRFNLLATCARRGVQYPFIGAKDQLQKSFLDHPADAPFTGEQIEYNAAAAVAAAAIHPTQVQAAVHEGCLNHLIEVEMPWVVTNGRMAFDGVRIDAEKCQAVLAACVPHQERLGAELRSMGLENANSHPQMERFFGGLQLLEPFRVRGGYSFSDDLLGEAENLHPAIPMIRLVRKIRRLQSDKALTGELIGLDGRLHPEHRQLGAESGRNSMRWPNIGGIGRVLRPVVVPEPGFGIGELDLSQIEVGIAAALFNDPDLIKMFNGQDVYCAMVRSYYRTELSPEAFAMPDKAFKKQFSHFRDRMKVFTLATIYNITPYGLSLKLGVTPEQAGIEQAKFLCLFPSLSVALQEASAYGGIRGYAYLCSGLRRLRARDGIPSKWETNWMRNSPVQGSAAIVFKVAGNRLYRRLQHYGARLVLPMHDAFVFEAPLKHLDTVAKIAAEVMVSSVQEYFPSLDPHVDVNVDHPECWNKDGHPDSLVRWLDDPMYSF